MKLSPNKNSRGFSLLEVVVAMTLLLLLLLLLSEISNTALHFCHRSQEQIKSSSEARAALQLITSDLRSAIVLPNTSSSKEYFFSTSDPDSKNGFLYFLATLPPEKRSPSDLGDLCTVGYFLSAEKKERGEPVQYLYRFYLPSKITTQALKEENLLECSQNAAFSTNPLCERVASNIAHFEVTPVWHEENSFSTDATKNLNPPSLVEIVLETVPRALSQKKEMWRTVIVLHP